MSALQFIEEVYEMRAQLTAKEPIELTDAERRRFKAIGKALDELYEIRRAELVYAQHGEPRLISGCDPKSQPQVRRFVEEMTARGVQPLPSALEVGR